MAKIDRLLRQTAGIWTNGDGLKNQIAIRDEWLREPSPNRPKAEAYNKDAG